MQSNTANKTQKTKPHAKDVGKTLAIGRHNVVIEDIIAEGKPVFILFKIFYFELSVAQDLIYFDLLLVNIH